MIIAGTVGSYLGSAITYWVCSCLGARLILRYRKVFVLLTPTNLSAPRSGWQRYEAGGVFFARLLPVIRHLISIPAGIVRMNFWYFSLVTIAGSAIWCCVLAYLGAKAFQVRAETLDTDPEAMVALHQSQVRIGSYLVVVVLALSICLVLRLTAPAQSRVVRVQ